MRSGRATPGYLYKENQDGRTGRCPLGSDGSTQNPLEPRWVRTAVEFLLMECQPRGCDPPYVYWLSIRTFVSKWRFPRRTLDVIAMIELASPRLRQSLAALGFGYGLNEESLAALGFGYGLNEESLAALDFGYGLNKERPGGFGRGFGIKENTD
jgi:hypothetical protein